MLPQLAEAPGQQYEVVSALMHAGKKIVAQWGDPTEGSRDGLPCRIRQFTNMCWKELHGDEDQDEDVYEDIYDEIRDDVTEMMRKKMESMERCDSPKSPESQPIPCWREVLAFTPRTADKHRAVADERRKRQKSTMMKMERSPSLKKVSSVAVKKEHTPSPKKERSVPKQYGAVYNVKIPAQSVPNMLFARTLSFLKDRRSTKCVLKPGPKCGVNTLKRVGHEAPSKTKKSTPRIDNHSVYNIKIPVTLTPNPPYLQKMSFLKNTTNGFVRTEPTQQYEIETRKNLVYPPEMCFRSPPTIHHLFNDYPTIKQV